MSAPQVASPRGHNPLVLVAGILVSVLLFWWAARGLDLGQVLRQLRTLPPGPVVLTVVVATLTFPLRLVRWRWLLRTPTGPLPWPVGWHAIAIGFMGNNVLPFRAGEPLRAWVASRLADVRWSGAFASIALERVLDLMTVVGLLVLALVTATLPPGLRIMGMDVPALARVVAIASSAALLMAALVLVRPAPFIALIRRLVPWPRVADRLVSLLEGVREGVAALRSPVRLAAVVAGSLAVWLVNALSFYLLFPAFGIEAGFSAALVLQAALVFGVAVPSTPGYIGVFEAVIVAILGLYGVPQQEAFAYAVTYHATTFVPITLLGAWSVVGTPLRWRELREQI